MKNRNYQTKWTALGAIAAVTLSMGLGACGQEDETVCATWVERLKTSGQLERSLERIGSMKCVDALPTMRALYEQGQLQERIMQTVKAIDHREGEAVEIIRLGLKTNKLVNMASGIAEDWKLAAVKPDLMRIMQDENLVSLRQAAFPALLALADPAELEDVLLGVATADPNSQSVAAFNRAVVELGKLGSKKAIPALLKLAYFRNNKGEEVWRAVRDALASIDDPSIVPALLSILKGTHEEIRTYARSMNIPEWELTTGVKTVRLIVDRLEPSTLPALLDSLEKDLAPPQGMSDRAFDSWRIGQMNRLKVILFGLGHFGDDTVVERLAAMVANAELDAVNQRMIAATALAIIGSEAAQDALLDAFQKVEDIFQPPLLQELTRAIDDRRLGAFDALFAENRRRARGAYVPTEAVTSALNTDERIANFLSVTRECGDDLGCYIQKTKSEVQDTKVKALQVLARGRFGYSPLIRDAFLDAFKASDSKMTDVRRFATTGITRLGDASDGKRLLELAEGLDDKDAFWKEELAAFGHAQSRK